jgi:hypothetical protein
VRITEYSSLLAFVLLLAFVALGAVAVSSNNSFKHTLEQTLGGYTSTHGGDIESK